MYNVRYRHLLPRRVYGTLGQGGLDTAHLINALRGALALGEVTSAPLLLVYRPHERCAFVYDGGGDVTDPAVVGGFLAEYRAGRVTLRETLHAGRRQTAPQAHRRGEHQGNNQTPAKAMKGMLQSSRRHGTVAACAAPTSVGRRAVGLIGRTSSAARWSDAAACTPGGVGKLGTGHGAPAPEPVFRTHSPRGADPR